MSPSSSNPNVSYFAVLYFLFLIEVLCMGVYGHKLGVKWHFWLTAITLTFVFIVFAYFVDSWMGNKESFRFEVSPDKKLCDLARVLPNTGEKIYPSPKMCCPKDRMGYGGKHEMSLNNWPYRADATCNAGADKGRYADTATPQANCEYKGDVENFEGRDKDLLAQLKELDVDFYYGDYCGFCHQMKEMLKKAGADKVVNFKNTKDKNNKPPDGVAGVPCSVSNTTKAMAVGAQRSVKELVDKLSKKENFHEQSNGKPNGGNDLRSKLKALDIDFYHNDGCGFCTMAKKLLKDNGCEDAVNYKKDVPKGVAGVPHFRSKVTGQQLTGYPKTLENLLAKLGAKTQVKENYKNLRGNEVCCNDYYEYEKYLVPGVKVEQTLAGGNPNYCNGNCQRKHSGQTSSGILGV